MKGKPSAFNIIENIYPPFYSIEIFYQARNFKVNLLYLSIYFKRKKIIKIYSIKCVGHVHLVQPQPLQRNKYFVIFLEFLSQDS